MGQLVCACNKQLDDKFNEIVLIKNKDTQGPIDLFPNSKLMGFMYDEVDEIEDMLVRSRWAKIDPND